MYRLFHCHFDNLEYKMKLTVAIWHILIYVTIIDTSYKYFIMIYSTIMSQSFYFGGFSLSAWQSLTNFCISVVWITSYHHTHQVTHNSSSWVKIKLHTEKLLPLLPWSNLKSLSCGVKVGSSNCILENKTFSLLTNVRSSSISKRNILLT